MPERRGYFWFRGDDAIEALKELWLRLIEGFFALRVSCRHQNRFRFLLVPVSFVPAFFFVPSPIALSTELHYDPTLH